MRALATNGNIRLPFTVKSTQWGATPRGVSWKNIVEDEYDLQKHCLWRRSNSSGRSSYSCDLEDEERGRELLGIIEQVRISGNVVRFHVIVRGVISVPMWWFTTAEYEARVHHLFGPTFVKPLFFSHASSAGRRSGHFLKPGGEDRGSRGVLADYQESLRGKASNMSRHKMIQINCFFRV